MRCLFKLYAECYPAKESKRLEELRNSDPNAFIDAVCSYCIKAYRLRRGLKTVIEGEGVRVGVTL